MIVMLIKPLPQDIYEGFNTLYMVGTVFEATSDRYRAFNYWELNCPPGYPYYINEDLHDHFKVLES